MFIKTAKMLNIIFSPLIAAAERMMLLSCLQYVSSLNSVAYGSKVVRESSASPPPPSLPVSLPSTSGTAPVYTSPSPVAFGGSPALGDGGAVISGGLSASSLASWFLHPATLGYPWTINLMAASSYRYNPTSIHHLPFGGGGSSSSAVAAAVNAAGSGSSDLMLQRNSR